MIAKFFGQFLLERGALTGDQLLQAVEHQRAMHQKFGSYALRFGYLTLDQINELHREQIYRSEKIGELAVARGFLTKEQVAEILLRQKNDHLLLGEAIVKLGFMDREGLYLRLDEYHRLTMAEDLHIAMDHFPEEPVLLKLCELLAGLLSRFFDLKAKPLMPMRQPQVRYEYSCAVARLANRRKPIRVVLAAPPAVSRAIAGHFFGTQGPLDEKSAKEAVEEFLNVLCGNFIGKASQMGRFWELEAPLTHPPGEPILPLYGDQLIRIPFATPDHTIDLVFDVGGAHAHET
jgi:hypothetical protein